MSARNNNSSSAGSWHINKDNDVLECNATVRECRYLKVPNSHFSSFDEATAEATKRDNGGKQKSSLRGTRKNRARKVSTKKSASEWGFSDEPVMYFSANIEDAMMADIEQENIIAELPEGFSEAVADYVGNDYYRALNSMLRTAGDEVLSADPETLPPRVRHLRSLVENLDKGLVETEEHAETHTVFRGVNQDTAGELLKMAKDKTVLDSDKATLLFPGYTSASSSADCASWFSEPDSMGGGVLLEMRTKKGLFVSGSEQEVILPRETKWRVIGTREVVLVTDDENADEEFERKRTIIQLVGEEVE